MRPAPPPATRLPARVGGHVPVAGGLLRALDQATTLGADVVQVFVSNPRGWATPAGDPAADEAFAVAAAARDVSVFVHASYLVNLGSPTAETVTRSAASLAHALARGRAIGAAGVVVHGGSSVDPAHLPAALRQLREHLLPLLDGLPDDAPDLLVEPTAGGGRALCATVEELGPWFDALDHHPRLKVCLDTCHAWAAGHDLAAEGGAAATLDALTATVGPGRLALVHANDSKDPLGSARDRHEAIGAGHLGLDAFRALLAHPSVAGVPLVLETPGGLAANAAEVALLRDLGAR